MPLFDTEYQVETDPETMSWEATDEHGNKIMFRPHICESHQFDEDHRGYIDMITLTVTPFGLYLPPQEITMNLTQISIIIEGLTEAGRWAHLNQGLHE